MHSPTVQKLIDLFSKFPTVGPRTAARFVFYLLKLSKEEVKELTSAILKLKDNVRLCDFCFKSFEPSAGQQDSKLCQICQDSNRNKELLCIIEKETDLISIEKTKKYQGFYFILGGTVSRLKKTDIEKLKIKELEKRIKNDLEIKEIILALNPTAEGEATARYLERFLKPLNKKITHLGRGLPLGGELEYADGETLSSALESRR